jgi:hypothetical protein
MPTFVRSFAQTLPQPRTPTPNTIHAIGCKGCKDTHRVARCGQCNKDDSCDSPMVRAMPQAVKAGLRGVWPRTRSKQGSGSREMFVEDRYAHIRAQGDQMVRGQCESDIMDVSSRGTTCQVDHVPEAQALADFAQLRASGREESAVQGPGRPGWSPTQAPDRSGRARRRGIRLFIFMTSLRCSPGREPRGHGEDCIASPGEEIWATSGACLGVAETVDTARSVALPPEISEGWRSCQ